ncbi:trefoil factor 1 [Dipodomys merriami]|uniref:trefoil factor 1 n=1 Tax=Dipodomys merriami TaxID=94247 RepID=UPI003855A695
MEHKATCVLLMVLLLALSALAQDQKETCTMSLRERVNCGYPGVTEQECKNRGCCFDNRVLGFPWCFYPVDVPSSSEGTEPLEEECPF